MLYFTSTTAPTHEPFEVRVKDRIYTIVMSAAPSGTGIYVDPELVSALTTTVATADGNATVHVRAD